MGLQWPTKWKNIPFTCILLMSLVCLVTGRLTWTDPIKYFQLQENTTVGNIIGSLKLESTTLGQLQITSTNSYVNVTQTQSGENYVEANVILNLPLDYEVTRNLICAFNGSISGSDSIIRTVPIFVEDVNEPPILQNKPYSVIVMENITKETQVYVMIRAIDVDSNDRVNYTITPSTQTTDVGKFRIDPNNGSLILTGILDFEDITFYQYTVTAMDNKGLIDSADVFITVGDVQDTPPYFTGEPFKVTINESIPIIPDFIRVKATDGDRGVPNEVSFKIASETCNDLFRIDDKSGMVSSNSSVDREADVFKDSGTCTLEIMAIEDDQHPQDNGIASTATTSVIITVMDINDNVPTFSASSYIVTVEENTQPGVLINFNTPISITDKDQGTNALFEVNVIKLEDYFEVTPKKIQSTGEIWIRVKNSTILDYEQCHNLTIEIEASDTIETSHRTTAIVTINISNINDNSPVFSNSSFYGSIFENSTSGTPVIMINATDADENDDHNNYGRVTYTLEGSDSSFEIDKTSGQIKVRGNNLDRETKDTYSLTVFAEDGGQSKASVPVEIKILDSNDETPTFVTNSYQTSLKEENYNLIPPITVLATDNDEKNSQNSEIFYMIVSSKPQGLMKHFKMNSTTGSLNVNSSLVYEDILFQPGLDGNINLTIEARDRGFPEKKSSVSVVIILQDINNNAPKCVQQLYTARVQENCKSKSVTQVNATDKDSTAPNNIIMYSIDQDSAGKFIINSSTGLLSLREPLNREEQSFYSIYITVTDNGAPQPLSGSCSVYVMVSDTNDVSPKFVQKSWTDDVKENDLELSVQTNATDPDENFQLFYDIDWQNCNAIDPSGKNVDVSAFKNVITIDHTTGEVTLVQPLDRETVSEFVLQIVVEDINATENSPQTDTATLTITVLDVNDEAPVFTGGSFYNASIRENMPDASDIKFNNQKRLEVSDADQEPENSHFEVRLLTHNTTFSINPESGTSKETFTISVLDSSALDFEKTQNFILEVLAIDKKNSSMYNSATISVDIINENDNIPKFLESIYMANVPENSNLATSVITVKAQDADRDPYGQVFYSLPDNPQEFIINKDSGEVSTNKRLDREMTETYTVSVRASDIGNFTTTTQLIITVSDINDNSPQFTGKQTSRTIPENDIYFSQPFIVEATDDDAPGNNSKLVYSLLSSEPPGLTPNFKINPATGEITLTSPLDYESLNQKQNGVIVLHVQAEDQGKPPKANTTFVTINVTDINDVRPQFDQPIYTTDIPENFHLEGTVFHITAVDGDSSNINNEVSYMIDTLSGSTFAINASSGEIILKKHLDYETVVSYQIIVTAMDHGNPVLTATAVVAVNVIDVNDRKPVFDQKQMQISEAEHLNISYKCSANDVDLNNSLQYSILWNMTSWHDGQGASRVNISEIKKWITIDTKTGEVKSLQALDRERVSVFVLQIVVEDINAEENRPQTDTATLTITVLDVNDEAPVFTGGSFYNASIRENMPDASDIKFNNQKRLEVSDADQEPENSHFEVRLLTHNTTFSISPESGTSKETFTISVLDSSALDFEKTQNFILEVLAIDKKNSSMYNSATISVDIINENDNIPKFLESIYMANVPENSNLATSVITVKAQDADRDPYGQVFYSLPDNPQEFIINKDSGEVSTNKRLDREMTETYTVSVRASDIGNFTTTTQLIITVSDINDNSPQFTGKQTSTTIPENDIYFSQPFIVEATDDDAPGNNSKLVYSLLSSEPPGLTPNFKINPDTGEITLTSPLDYESLNQKQNGVIVLQVQAEDQGKPPKANTTFVTINVTDINDVRPLFDQPIYTTDIPENFQLEGTVFHVTAVDGDSSSINNEVSYMIDTLSGSIFAINARSGEITLKKRLDYETVISYQIIVTAMDHGNPVLTATAVVAVNVTDVNDQNPVFEQKQWQISKQEHLSISYMCSANDVDMNNNLQYSIQWNMTSWQDGQGASGVNINEITKWITIDPTTGEVKSLKPLDRETVSEFVLQIVVKDINAEEKSPQTDTATLTITVLDVNDEAPVFTGGRFYNASIRENMPAASDIKFNKTLEVSDADQKGENSHFEVRLLTHNTTFSISPGSGTSKETFTISVLDSSALDFEKTQNFILEVLAFDPKNPSMNNSATILVNIINENDNIPEFLGGPYMAYVPENSATGTTVITVTATDMDDGVFGELTYSLDDSANVFHIDGITGEIVLLSDKLDRENIPDYTVTLIATDKGNFRATTQLSVVITDVNDNAPEFPEKPYQLFIDEETLNIIPTFNVQATDKDQPNTANSEISYLLLNVTPSLLESHFHVDSTSGMFSLISYLDYEGFSPSLKGTFTLTVMALDKGTPQKSANTSVIVVVKDVNDNPPIFEHVNYTVFIFENASEGEFVVTVKATDQDISPSNNHVSYMLDTASIKTFHIDTSTGNITVQGILDREKTPFYSVIVTAQDNGSPTKTSTTLIYVNVKDVNDSPPTFLWDSKSETVIENSNSIITQNLATDPDLNPNLYYSILWLESSGMDGDGRYISGDVLKNLVTINSLTGEVHPVNQLDREKVQRFQLTLVVEDKNNKPDSKNNDTAILTVVVEDLDDNSPTFNEVSFTAQIQENMPDGSEIKITSTSALIITDTDAGDNCKYNITLDNSSVFTISPSYGDGSTTCVIKVANPIFLDYEKQQNITIKVIATAHKTLQSSTATITVFIDNINDNFPIFNQSVFEVFVPENSHSGLFITKLQASDLDLGEFGKVHYFIDGTQTGFIIDNTTGSVTLNKNTLDRETQDSYTLTVRARDTGKFEGSTQLIIRVTDKNDMSPNFQQLLYTVEVKEHDTVFTVPLFVKATDDDDPNTNNSKISYKISKTPQELLTNPFTINKISGEIALLSPAPDYENLILNFPDGTFQIEVTATDWGIPPLNSTALINVTILDINDKTPVFDRSSYSGSVKENSAAGVIVATVKATDDDGTIQNKDLYYVIQSGSRDKLQINTTTGVISVGVGASLDRETTDLDGFTLIVLAIDKGSPPLTGSTTVSITVLDVNDSPPEIKPTSGLFTVNESVPIASQIADFDAYDKDENSNLMFRLLWSDSRALDEKERNVNVSVIQEWLDIDAVSGIISVKSNMDREKVEQMILKVVVADINAFNGTQEDTATVTVSLQDVNDNPPIITSSGSELQLSVSEGTKLDTEVTTLTATDADKGQIITFSLPDTNSSFRITGQGKLVLIKILDRETEPHLKFDVVAKDDGNPSMSSNITVMINVLDINDKDPYFLINQTTFSVYENSDNTTLVAIMKATDIDAGDNANVTFLFKDESSYFRIDLITGNIFVSEPADREKGDKYSLTVIAADNPLLEATRRTLQAIIIEVQDVNDNKPEFSSDIGYQGTISETASIGDVVQMTPGQISATDKDAGNNSVITFLLQDSGNNYFKLDPTSGQVKLNVNIMNLPNKYSYVVNATDNGSPALSTVTNLTITVSDENNNSPVFVNAGSISAISECEGSGVKVGHFNATDADTNKDTNGKVQYYLDSSTANNHSQYFYLNEDTGDLSTKSINNNQYMFADEELEELEITVIAMDCGVPQQLSTTVTVKIKVLDTNDNPPEFDSAVKTNFTVSEGLTDIKIGSFKASDKDKDSILTYHLSDTDNNPWKDYFNIITDTNDGGVIYVKKPLDREEVSQIKVKIIVSDKLSNATSAKCPDQKPDFDGYSTTLDINVFIEDINDNPPVFQEKSMFTGFLSSTKYGEKIISLLSYVNDNDTAPNSVHKFYQVGEIEADSNIGRTWNKNIQLNPVIVDINGTVSTNHKFIEEAYGYFILQILANDSAGSDTTSLKIFVVGESQVIHMTLWCTEDRLRQIQNNIIADLSDPDHKFIADNILPAYNPDGSVDSSKSVLVAHALDANENIIDGKTLVDYLDASPRSASIRNEYKIYSTQAGDQIGKSTIDNTKDRNLYILIGIIAVIAITFVITLYLLIQTIRRFKRKLKAATIEVHGMDPVKQDTFPGLDNDYIKSNNPIFMRDDLNLNESNVGDKYDYNNGDDTISNSSENSLDQNALNSPNMNVKSGIDEQEMTLDLYETDEKEPGMSNGQEHLHIKHSQFLRNDDNHSTSGVNREKSIDVVDGETGIDLNMGFRNFESTEI